MNQPAADTAAAAYPEALPECAQQFAQANSLQAQIDTLQRSDASLWATIVNRLRTDWTYHSNSIEGSTLSRGETHFFLSEGLTVEGKPFKDFVDAKNHAEAIDLLFDVVADKQAITEGLIKEINALLLRGVEFTPAKNALGQRVRKAAHPGQYKREANHVEQADGTIHWYVDPLHVTDQMQALVAWVNEALGRLHPIHIAAVAHYNMVRIHPFDDGNGRGARILMNLILMRQGHFPAVIRTETKRRYLEVLSLADQGELAPFAAFVAEAAIATKLSVLEVFDGRAAQAR